MHLRFFSYVFSMSFHSLIAHFFKALNKYSVVWLYYSLFFWIANFEIQILDLALARTIFEILDSHFKLFRPQYIFISKKDAFLCCNRMEFQIVNITVTLETWLNGLGQIEVDLNHASVMKGQAT